MNSVINSRGESICTLPRLAKAARIVNLVSLRSAIARPLQSVENWRLSNLEDRLFGLTERRIPSFAKTIGGGAIVGTIEGNRKTGQRTVLLRQDNGQTAQISKISIVQGEFDHSPATIEAIRTTYDRAGQMIRVESYPPTPEADTLSINAIGSLITLIENSQPPARIAVTQ